MSWAFNPSFDTPNCQLTSKVQWSVKDEKLTVWYKNDGTTWEYAGVSRAVWTELHRLRNDGAAFGVYFNAEIKAKLKGIQMNKWG